MLSFYLAMVDSKEDKNKIEQLYYNYKTDMYRIALSITKSTSDAEDAVQDAFLCFIQNISHFSEISCNKTRSYLFTIVRNKAFDILRSKNKRNEIDIEDDAEFICDDVSLDDKLLNKHKFNCIVEIIRHLAPKYKDVLVLTANQHSVKEISKLLETSENNVYQRLYRARKLVLSALEKEDNNE